MNKKGFTLVELLVVITMLGALTGIALSVINPDSARGKARDAVRNNNVKSLAEAIESYRQIENDYPENTETTDDTSLLRTVYIKDWPSPIANDGSIDPTNWSYEYNKIDRNNVVIFSPTSRGTCYKYQADWGRVMECPVAECTIDVSLESECN